MYHIPHSAQTSTSEIRFEVKKVRMLNFLQVIYLDWAPGEGE